MISDVSNEYYVINEDQYFNKTPATWSEMPKNICMIVFWKVDTTLVGLTHLPLVHIYASVNGVSIGSDNRMSPIRHQAII